MSEIDSQDLFRFEAEISEPKKLIPMLKAIHIMKTSVMAITRRGLKLTSQDGSRCLQANSFIDRSLFSHYYMSSEDCPQSLCFRLSDLLHILSILESVSTAPTFSDQPLGDHCLRIEYSSDSDQIKLQLREESVETKAYIKTYFSEELMLFDMNFINKVIVSAEPIVDFWRSADLQSDYVEIGIYSDRPFLQWSTESERAKVNHNISKDSIHVEQYVCTTTVRNKYKMSLMKYSLKALIHSSKLSVRTDDNGLLSLQFMIRLDESDTQHSFVEFFIVPDL